MAEPIHRKPRTANEPNPHRSRKRRKSDFRIGDYYTPRPESAHPSPDRAIKPENDGSNMRAFPNPSPRASTAPEEAPPSQTELDTLNSTLDSLRTQLKQHKARGMCIAGAFKTAMGPKEQKLRDAVKKTIRCFEGVDDAVSAAKDLNEEFADVVQKLELKLNAKEERARKLKDRVVGGKAFLASLAVDVKRDGDIVGAEKFLYDEAWLALDVAVAESEKVLLKVEEEVRDVEAEKKKAEEQRERNRRAEKEVRGLRNDAADARNAAERSLEEFLKWNKLTLAFLKDQ